MINIMIELDGKDYAMRVWPAVPRIGEWVYLGYPNNVFKVEVKAVDWGVNEGSAGLRPKKIDVRLYCERVPKV